MYKYVISLFFTLLCTNLVLSQEDKSLEKPVQELDSMAFKKPYGIRLGIDISKPILGVSNSDYSGLEFVADYRISDKWFIAAEFGREENRTEEDFLTTNSKGTYARIGANVNLYKNWLDMNNEIFIGFRYGFSSFDQTLESYTINSGDPFFSGNLITTPRLDSGLIANWFELMLGIKVETFKNFFVSFSGSYKLMISVDNPTNFQSLYAPGFNRIFASETGFGFNYTLSYLIPFKKK